MVVIRTLRPAVQIRMPRTERVRRSQVKVVRRTNAEFPPPSPQPTPCRLWQGAQGSDGYGWRKTTTDDGERRGVSMHRWVMSMVLERKLKPSEVVLHACDNPLCYRVDHLSVGTIADNNADMKLKGRASPPPVNVFRGEAHPMAKLSEAQVRRIRGHYQSGLAVKTIAAMFEVAPSTIRRVIKGVTWSTVGETSWRVKPPTRDLMAEARAAIEAREAPMGAVWEDPPDAASARTQRQRIRPVKPMKGAL